MRKRLCVGGSAVFFLCCHFMYSLEIKLLKQWRHDCDLGGEISHCLLDHDDNILLVHRPGISLVNEKQFVNFAQWGQGPNEIDNVYAMCEYQDGLAVFESLNKLKLFKKSAAGYYGGNRKWIKSNPSSYYLKDAFFVKDRFFLGGLVIKSRQKDKLNGALLKVYNDKSGQSEESLIPVQYPEPSRYSEIRKHFAMDGDHFFFLSQHEMKAYQISLNKIALEKTIELEIPEFYVPMPKSFFIYKKYKDDNGLWNDIVNWLTSYSAVTRMTVLQGGYLVIQVRTCNTKLQKFALLIYNIRNDFSLDKVIYMNDFLLAGRKDLLYCIHNGDPMEDEEANRLIVDVYKLLR